MKKKPSLTQMLLQLSSSTPLERNKVLAAAADTRVRTDEETMYPELVHEQNKKKKKMPNLMENENGKKKKKKSHIEGSQTSSTSCGAN